MTGRRRSELATVLTFDGRIKDFTDAVPRLVVSDDSIP
jgi:hypothetical protein